jgi:hypothetical protein
MTQTTLLDDLPEFRRRLKFVSWCGWFHGDFVRWHFAIVLIFEIQWVSVVWWSRSVSAEHNFIIGQLVC